MSRADKQKFLRSSILDRLIDEKPEESYEPEKDRHQQLKELRESVCRDLQNILNARIRHIEPEREFGELDESILNYGLPDLGTINIVNLENKKAFTRAIEHTLKTYEPRFKSVRVSYDNRQLNDRTLRFRIDAVIYADPAPEMVIFDSTLEPISRTVEVRESNNG